MTAARRALVGMVALLSMVLAACSTQQQPARRMLDDIQTAVNKASPDAAKYVPDQLSDVQGELGGLKASYDRKDYKAVISGGPAVLSAAEGLAGAAAAKKDLIMRGFSDQWSTLSSTIPGDGRAIQSRIDFLSERRHRKLASGVDLTEAKSDLSDAQALWSKAQDVHAQGNLEQAVTIARSAETKMADVAASMKLDLAQPAAVTSTAPTP